MYREDGKLAARGRHIKYLPMGVIWDMVATPFLFPLAREAQCRVHDRWLADPERTKAREELYDCNKCIHAVHVYP